MRQVTIECCGNSRTLFFCFYTSIHIHCPKGKEDAFTVVSKEGVYLAKRGCLEI